MKLLAAIGGVAVLQVLAAPAVVLAQARDSGVPGGVTSAWPLGIIVLLVVLMMLVGTLLARRGSGPPHHP